MKSSLCCTECKKRNIRLLVMKASTQSIHTACTTASCHMACALLRHRSVRALLTEAGPKACDCLCLEKPVGPIAVPTAKALALMRPGVPPTTPAAVLCILIWLIRGLQHQKRWLTAQALKVQPCQGSWVCIGVQVPVCQRRLVSCPAYTPATLSYGPFMCVQWATGSQSLHFDCSGPSDTLDTWTVPGNHYRHTEKTL